MWDTIVCMEVKTTSTYDTWLNKLKDRQAKARIIAKTDIIQMTGTITGDVEPVGGGISELRFHFGGGYRIYFAHKHNEIMLLIAGGDKNSQPNDIKQAQQILDALKGQQLW